MHDYYAQIKLLHVGCALASGCLFAVRGLLLQAGIPLARSGIVRVASMAIDTLLLMAAIALMIVLGIYPGRVPWLTAKIFLVLLYIVLGSFALRRGRTPAIRRACFIAALGVFLLIVSVARHHDPLGALRGVF